MGSSSETLECDYLVVGAGAASLAFIDTLLTELPDTKVILIDKKEQPGGGTGKMLTALYAFTNLPCSTELHPNNLKAIG